MSREIALELVKALATAKRASVSTLSKAVATEESNIREWLYAMEAKGMAKPSGKEPRIVPPGYSPQGKRMVQVWEWLL